MAAPSQREVGPERRDLGKGLAPLLFAPRKCRSSQEKDRQVLTYEVVGLSLPTDQP